MVPENIGQDFGAGLRRARERAGLSLRRIADITKLSVRVLDALERNRVDLLPGGIYRRAIVRAYASEVGLNPEATLRAFLALHPDDLLLEAQQVAEPVRKRGLLRGFMSVFGILAPVVSAVVAVTFGARGR
jgi:cytoskeletal protein RodZ